jgi:hypothetical protein
LQAGAVPGILERSRRQLRQHGTTAGLEDQLMSFDRFNELIGVEAKHALAERFGA